MDIKNIIEQHPKSVARVFKARGVKKPTTEENLMLQALLSEVNEDGFIDQLCDQIEADSMYTGFGDFDFLPNISEGIKKAQASPAYLESALNMSAFATKKKVLPDVNITVAKQKSSKVRNTLTDLVNILAGGLGKYSAAKQNQNTGTVVVSTGTTPGAPLEKKKQSFILIAVVALVVALVVAVILKKSK